MAERNGKWTLATVVGVIGLVSGLVIGGLGSLTQAQTNFVDRKSYDDHRREIARRLDRIDAKLDELVRAVERNSVKLERGSR